MIRLLKGILIIACVLYSAHSAAVCKPSAEIQLAIAHLRQARTVDDAMPYFQTFEGDPYTAACHLVSGLHPVPQVRIEHTDKVGVEAWEIVWRIRALRFITGGVDFVASSASDFSGGGQARRNILELKGSRAIPFFRVWESRDIIFIAPQDTQESIINQWQLWFRGITPQYQFKKATTIDQWYF